MDTTLRGLRAHHRSVKQEIGLSRKLNGCPLGLVSDPANRWPEVDWGAECQVRDGPS